MYNRTSLVTVGATLVLFMLLTVPALSQLSKDVINYQGKLEDSVGLMDGPATMIFAIYDSESPGADLPLWFEEHVGVQIETGIFNVVLGSQTGFPVNLFDTYDDLYLRVTVEGEDMAPLQHLTATPYAMKAETANHAHTATSADSILTGEVSGNLLVDGSVGIGTDTPESLMHLSSMGGIDLIIDADTNNSGGEDQNARVVLRQDGGQVSGRMGYRHEENDLEIMQEYNDDLIFGTNDLDRMTIKGDGKIGIGTTNPEAKLHVEMANGIPTLPPVPSLVGGVVIRDGTFNIANQLEIQDNDGTARVVVDSAGQVGIGTATPATTLEVQGVVSIDGYLGVGTTTPGASMEINGNGNSPLNGFIILRNADQDAGIRIYDGNNVDDVKHHIFNDNINALIPDALRIAPDGSFDQGGITITQGGFVGIGTAFPTELLTVNGRTKTEVLEITGGSDLSERFDIRGTKKDLLPSPGMVVSIDPRSPGSLMVTSKAYDKKVVGIISGAGGVNPGMLMGQKKSMADGAQPVALTGRVYCQAVASNGAITPGDLLTTSDTPGYAMKVIDYQKAQGAILGKAMTGLDEKKGLVLVVVTLQ